jgi:hypothetical protein
MIEGFFIKKEQRSAFLCVTPKSFNVACVDKGGVLNLSGTEFRFPLCLLTSITLR